jgi:hypothetical protein
MKNASFISAATLFVLLFACCTALSAQKTATWKGGTPGRSTDWNCPTNWKEGRVPDEFSNVVVPDVSTSTFACPVIERGEVEVLSLACAPTSRVTVRSKARLIVAEASEMQDHHLMAASDN